jgi:hypothetical protein
MANAEEELVHKLIQITMLKLDRKESEILDGHMGDTLTIVTIKNISTVNNQIHMDSIKTVMVTVFKQCDYEGVVEERFLNPTITKEMEPKKKIYSNRNDNYKNKGLLSREKWRSNAYQDCAVDDINLQIKARCPMNGLHLCVHHSNASNQPDKI